MRDRLKPVGLYLRLTAYEASNQGTTLQLSQKLSAIVRVNVDTLIGQAISDHKVVWQANPIDLDADTFPHLHIEERERDRDAHVGLQHFVEEAIIRIIVVCSVAVKLFLTEEPLVERIEYRK